VCFITENQSKFVHSVQDLRDELENLVEITRDMQNSDDEEGDHYDTMFGSEKNGGKGDSS
jgi:hypothetical protein